MEAERWLWGRSLHSSEACLSKISFCLNFSPLIFPPRFGLRWRHSPGCDFPALHLAAQLVRPVFLSRGHEDLAASVVGPLEQGQQPAAAFEVEFTHNIIDEQDRRASGQASYVLG